MGLAVTERRFLAVPTAKSRENSKSPCLSRRGTVSCVQQMDIEEEFNILKTLSEGCFSKILLARKDRERFVLKAVHCEVTSGEDFSRELHQNYFLSPHPNIITSYNVAFLWDNCYVYVQEYAPYGDLSRLVRKGGLPESHVKSMAQQIVSALEFIHSFNLVHQNVRTENILVFRKDLSLVKLCDFRNTKDKGCLLSKKTSPYCQSYEPPELNVLLPHEKYHCDMSTDVWQMGIVLVTCLFGGAPWSCADIVDPCYTQYVDWIKRKSLKTPEEFQFFTSRFQRLLKRILEPKPSKRYKIIEITKYFTDDWVIKGSHAARKISLERHESNATSKSGHRQKYYGKKKSSKSLIALENELVGNIASSESLNERVGRWIDSNSNQCTSDSPTDTDDPIFLEEY